MHDPSVPRVTYVVYATYMDIARTKNYIRISLVYSERLLLFFDQ